MKKFVSENSELIFTTFKIILAIILPFLTLIKNLIKNKNDPKSVIKRSIIEKEKKIINNYFDELNYQELNTIKENNYEIDSEIYKLVNKQYNNKPLQMFINEITRVDRYKTVKKIISKINTDTSFKKTFVWFVIVISNYLFYFSKTLLNLFFYAFFIMIIVVPLFYVFSFIYMLYNFMGKYIFGVFIFTFSIFLVSKGENKKEKIK